MQRSPNKHGDWFNLGRHEAYFVDSGAFVIDLTQQES